MSRNRSRQNRSILTESAQPSTSNSDIVVDDDFQDNPNVQIGDFICLENLSDASDSDESCLKNICTALRNTLFLLIQIAILVSIGIQLYYTFYDPNFNFILRTLSDRNGQKLYDASNDPIVYNNLFALKKQISELQSEILYIKTFINEIINWKNDLERKSISMIPPKNTDEINDKIRTALMLYDADKLGIVDYALESAGGTVVSILDTKPYPLSILYEFFGFIPIKSYSNPNLVIQPQNSPGECFAFHGSFGKIRIQLAKKIEITNFTIEHVNYNLVDDLSNAPKEIAVYGLDNGDSNNIYKMANYIYDINKESVQTFSVDERAVNRIYEFVELHVLSNHGNKELTCIYRFRVHGNKIKNA